MTKLEVTMTLSTDRMGFSPSTTNFDDEAMTRGSDGKVKTVTSQLVHNWQLLMTSECNINLFKKIRRKVKNAGHAI